MKELMSAFKLFLRGEKCKINLIWIKHVYRDRINEQFIYTYIYIFLRLHILLYAQLYLYMLKLIDHRIPSLISKKFYHVFLYTIFV